MLFLRRGIWVAAAMLLVAFAHAALGQDTVPDAPQPALQTKAAPQTPAPQSQAPADAAPAPALQNPPRSDGNDFPFPDAAASQSKKPAADHTAPDSTAPDKNDFPFPDEAEKPAAPTTPAKTGAASEPTPEPAPPPGYSSSSSSSLHDEGSGGEIGGQPDAKRAEKDKSVARFYWNVGDYAGSYLRFKDAVIYAPLNPEMWYGLADSERMMGKYMSAREHFQKYLQLAPEGAKAKDSAKYLRTLPEKDKPQSAGPGPRVP